MKKLIIILVVISVCTSCKDKETVREELQILIQNRTDSSIHITLYPKAEYQSGKLYLQSDIGSGYNHSEYSLWSNNEGYYNWDEVLFVSGDLSIEPHILAAKVFDSIHISSSNKDSVIIKFTHENVTGYSENLFSENSMWEFRMYESTEPDMFNRNPVKSYCYAFLILKDKMIIE